MWARLGLASGFLGQHPVFYSSSSPADHLWVSRLTCIIKTYTDTDKEAMCQYGKKTVTHTHTHCDSHAKLQQAILPTKAKSFAPWLSSMCVATSVAVTAITCLQPVSTMTLKDTSIQVRSDEGSSS